MEFVYLGAFAFLAGLIDSVAGGGGLIQLPALFLFLPSSAASVIPSIMGTNKLVSMCGTSLAAMQYARHVSINWHTVLPAAVAAFIFSALGARVVSLIDKELLKPAILLLLIAVAIYTFIQKDLGKLHAPNLSPKRERWIGILVGVVIGFYDGFFGPGTGSFLILIFIGVFGFSFLNASASAKIINLATNLAAVLYFAITDQIYYQYALPMAVCNVLGSQVGTRLAILKGNEFVRILFLVVISGMILRLGWEMFQK